MLIDDFSSETLISRLGTRWRGVSDQVMGGVSKASVFRDMISGRSCLRLTGDVRLENNGGFIQASLDLTPSDNTLDASGYTGVRLVVYGNGERYSVHLRTPTMSVLGSPTGPISQLSLAGRRSIFPSQISCLIG